MCLNGEEQIVLKKTQKHHPKEKQAEKHQVDEALRGGRCSQH